MKISISVLLTLLFVGLKLTDHIDWSWWWIVCPIIISVAWSIIQIGLTLIYMAYSVKKGNKERKQKSSDFKKSIQEMVKKQDERRRNN